MPVTLLTNSEYAWALTQTAANRATIADSTRATAIVAVATIAANGSLTAVEKADQTATTKAAANLKIAALGWGYEVHLRSTYNTAVLAISNPLNGLTGATLTAAQQSLRDALGRARATRGDVATDLSSFLTDALWAGDAIGAHAALLAALERQDERTLSLWIHEDPADAAAVAALAAQADALSPAGVQKRRTTTFAPIA